MSRPFAQGRIFFAALLFTTSLLAGCSSINRTSSVEMVQDHQYRVHEENEFSEVPPDAAQLSANAVCSKDGNRAPQILGHMKAQLGTHYVHNLEILCVEPGKKSDVKALPISKEEWEKRTFIPFEFALLTPLVAIPPSGISKCFESSKGGKEEMEKLNLKYTARFAFRNSKYYIGSLTVTEKSEKARRCAEWTKAQVNKEGFLPSEALAKFAEAPDHKVLITSGEVMPLRIYEVRSESGKFHFVYSKPNSP